MLRYLGTTFFILSRNIKNVNDFIIVRVYLSFDPNFLDMKRVNEF